MSLFLKSTIYLTFCLTLLFVGGFVYAEDTATSVLQPASASKIGDLGHYIDEYNSYISTNTAWHFDETAHFPDVHIGEQGVGGVTFFNGTIINKTTNSNGGGIPVTFGDDVRIDGSIWRGPSKGTSDNKPLKIADTVEPEITNLNNIGSTNKKWKDGYWQGTVWMGKLGGDNVVTEENLNAVNSAVANYVLAYDSDGKFKWTNSTLSALSCSAGQIAKWNGTAWACADDASSGTLGSLSCSTGQVAKWNGTAWACAADIDTNTGGTITPPPAGTNHKICYGRTQVPAFDIYGSGGTAVSIPSNCTLTGVNTYTVTASYSTNVAPDGMQTGTLIRYCGLTADIDDKGPCLSVGVIRNSATQFTLYTNFPGDPSGGNVTTGDL